MDERQKLDLMAKDLGIALRFIKGCDKAIRGYAPIENRVIYSRNSVFEIYSQALGIKGAMDRMVHLEHKLKSLKNAPILLISV
jgi:hypothetical protein